MEIFLEILQKFGLPVAAAAAMGTFIYIILKYILGGVVGSVKSLHGIITVSYTHLTLPTTPYV